MKFIKELENLCYKYSESKSCDKIYPLLYYLKKKEEDNDQVFINYKEWFHEGKGFNMKLSYYIAKYFSEFALELEDKRYPMAENHYHDYGYNIDVHIERMRYLICDEVSDFLLSLPNNQYNRIINRTSDARSKTK